MIIPVADASGLEALAFLPLSSEVCPAPHADKHIWT